MREKSLEQEESAGTMWGGKVLLTVGRYEKTGVIRRRPGCSHARKSTRPNELGWKVRQIEDFPYYQPHLTGDVPL
jgi:hypothetical protein